MRKIILYQIFTRLFGNKNTQPIHNGTLLENGVGKMNDISDKALVELRNLGITDVWFTGIIEHATTTAYPNIPPSRAEIVKGKAGSPYAIRDYFDIAPDLAENVEHRMLEFEQLVKRTHKAGLSVWIDFVPNHVARDYHSDIFPEFDFGCNDDVNSSFSAQNNFYYLTNKTLSLSQCGNHSTNFMEFPAKVTGNDCFSEFPTSNDWYDTVKLNYGIDFQNEKAKHFDPIPDTWVKMLYILEFWCSKGVDGFRCDMAEMVPVEFWQWAMVAIKKRFPNVKFIAEIYQPELYQPFINAGFDFLYDKVGLYDTLRAILEGKANAKSITQCWEKTNGLDSKMLRFLENHDEQRIASDFFAGNPFKALSAMVLTATINTGPVMIYFGQEVGESAAEESGFSGNDGRTTIFDYWNVPEHQKWMNDGKFDGEQLSENQKILRKFYKELFHLCQREPIAEGAFYDLLWANENRSLFHQNIYAYLRFSKTEKLLIILNFSNQQLKGKVVIPQHAFDCMNLKKMEYRLQPIFGVGEEQTVSVNEMITNGISFELDESRYLIYSLK